ncbi:MAG: hypothetical protein ACETWG_05675 [Candidatus Neomarinimicrobiota bacterium]
MAWIKFLPVKWETIRDYLIEATFPAIDPVFEKDLVSRYSARGLRRVYTIRTINTPLATTAILFIKVPYANA